VAHQVRVELPAHGYEVGKSDFVFEVREDDELLGHLEVSQGAVVWRPAHKKIKLKAAWSQFDKIMRDHAPGEE